MPKPLSIDLPRIDAGTQSRLKINEDVVEDYASLISESNGEWPFPPIDVFHDGTDYFVADGFHRFLGAHRAKRGSIPCNIHKGTAKDARIFGMTANDRHGLRMTRADKRACVEWLLDNGGKMSQKEIAEKAGVSKRLVQMVIADRNPASIAGKAQIAPSTPSGGESTTRDKPPGRESRRASGSSAGKGGSQRDTKPDYGKCPNCTSTKWDEDEDGVSCAKCHHPHGEPVGDPDEDRIKTQRQKAVKTVEAAMRAFDDLQTMQAHRDHGDAIECCKRLLKIARAWK